MYKEPAMRIWFVVLTIAAVGCSTHYVPRSRGRLAVVMEDGKPAYSRDGQVFSHGILGGGLVDAVAGNPQALDAAREYRSRVTTGLVVGLGGLVCSSVAFGLAITRLEGETPGRRDGEVYAWTALGCLAASLIGLTYGVTAEPYRWDAINIYNDGIELQQMQGPPGMPFSATPRPRTDVSLQMH
jgi:hypothetical protein